MPPVTGATPARAARASGDAAMTPYAAGDATSDESGERYEVDTRGELRQGPSLTELARAHPSLTIDGEASNQ